jgi:hypothetical protein
MNLADTVKLPIYLIKYHIMKTYGHPHFVRYCLAPGQEPQYILDWGMGGPQGWSVSRVRSLLYQE